MCTSSIGSYDLVLVAVQISDCDNILASMEEMLGKFQSDLGNISTEIRSLQEQSQSMSLKLKNRKGAEQQLGTFIENIAIPGNLIDGIMQTDVGEGFLDHLLTLKKKLDFAESNEVARDSASFRYISVPLVGCFVLNLS